MKVVAKGIDLITWFVDKEDTCWRCRARVRFTRADADKVRDGDGTDPRDAGIVYLRWSCPGCGAKNSLAGPRP